MNSGKIGAGGRDGWTSKVLQEVLADLKRKIAKHCMIWLGSRFQNEEEFQDKFEVKLARASCCDNKNPDSITSTAEFDAKAYLEENFPINFIKSLAKLL